MGWDSVGLAYTKPWVLSPAPGNAETRHVEHACHPVHGEAEAEGLGVQGHIWLHNELKDSLGYMRTPLPR